MPIQFGAIDAAARPIDDALRAERAHKSNWLIHIGYHRTGSSFLQTELFPLMSGVAVTSDSCEAKCYINAPDCDLAILTNESLSSDLKCDTPQRAPELARTFPGARILIGIRSQYSVMRGAYHLHMKSGAPDDYETFVKARCGRVFDYARTVDAYRQAFGPDSVFVLLHENLSRDPVGSMAALLRFAGSDPALATKVRNRRIKASAGDPMLCVLRSRNRLIAPLRELWPFAFEKITYWGVPGASFIDRVLEGRVRLPAERVRSMICEAYADGNARLFASLGLDPADYGYPVSEKS